MRFQVAPMESLDKQLGGETFDVVFVYEARCTTRLIGAPPSRRLCVLEAGGLADDLQEPEYLHAFLFLIAWRN